MNKIRLLTISATCERGGSDINLLRLLRSLGKGAYDILHLVPYPGPLTDEFRNAGVGLEIVDMPRIRIFKNPLKYMTILLKFFPTVFKIKNIIRDNQIDLVCTSSMVNLYGALAAKLAHRPHILVTGEYLSMLKLFSIYFYLLSEKVVCSSNIVSTMFPKSTKITVLPHGIDLNGFSPDISGKGIREELGASGSLVSMITRLAPWKGVEVFIKAARYLDKDVKCAIIAEPVIGKERYTLKLEKIIERVGLKGRVLIKLAEYKDIPKVMAASDIVVHASLRPEPFGLIIIEAMATGKPVIASKTGGPLEIISDGIDGVLIEPGNPRVLAAAISDLLANPDRAEEIGRKAREKVIEKFDLRGYARSLDKIFKETLDEYSLKCARISLGKNRLLKISAPLVKLLVPVTAKHQNINKDAIKRIMVIQLFGMGDLICSLPLLEMLKKYFNHSRITLLVDRKLNELTCLFGSNYEVIGYGKGILSKFKIISDIRKNRFDLVIILNPLFQGAWISYLSRAKYRLGYVRDYEGIQNIEKLSCLLTHPITPADKPMHDMQRYLDIAESLGIEIIGTSPELLIPQTAAEWADRFLRENAVRDNDFILGINPHAAWESKCWDTQRFSEIADIMRKKYNAKVIFFGSSASSDIARINLIRPLQRHKAIYAAGKTDIPELAALLKRCGIFLTNDSGPMHLAAALGINMVALFGPSDVRKFGYEKENIINIAANDSFCKPYALNGGACMKGIEVKDVIQAIEILLRNKNDQGYNKEIY